MIIAELKGKIPSKLKDKEDILTSNVFSFFKYSNRRYLKDYLSELGLKVSIEDTNKAEFQFWPSYEDGTEPDLVIICGDYYILFEAKLFSDFSAKVIDIETNEIEIQLEREARMGQMEAKNSDKQFILIALTSEYYKKKDKYKKIDSSNLTFIWTNWQFVANFLFAKMEDPGNHHDLLHLNDLYDLLAFKKLRSFVNLSSLKHGKCVLSSKNIFYNNKTSMFKGEYSGFLKILANLRPIIQPIPNKIFYHGNN